MTLGSLGCTRTVQEAISSFISEHTEALFVSEVIWMNKMFLF